MKLDIASRDALLNNLFDPDTATAIEIANELNEIEKKLESVGESKGRVEKEFEKDLITQIEKVKTTILKKVYKKKMNNGGNDSMIEELEKDVRNVKALAKTSRERQEVPKPESSKPVPLKHVTIIEPESKITGGTREDFNLPVAESSKEESSQGISSKDESSKDQASKDQSSQSVSSQIESPYVATTPSVSNDVSHPVSTSYLATIRNAFTLENIDKTLKSITPRQVAIGAGILLLGAGFCALSFFTMGPSIAIPIGIVLGVGSIVGFAGAEAMVFFKPSDDATGQEDSGVSRINKPYSGSMSNHLFGKKYAPEQTSSSVNSKGQTRSNSARNIGDVGAADPAKQSPTAVETTFSSSEPRKNNLHSVTTSSVFKVSKQADTEFAAKRSTVMDEEVVLEARV